MANIFAHIYAIISFHIHIFLLTLNRWLTGGLTSFKPLSNDYSHTIILIGDSIAAGVGDRGSLFDIGGLVQYFTSYMRPLAGKKIRQKWTIVNKGVAGSTTREWHPEYRDPQRKENLFQQALESSHGKHAEIAIIMMGRDDERFNQSLHFGNPSTTNTATTSLPPYILPPETFANISTLARAAAHPETSDQSSRPRQVYVCTFPTKFDPLVVGEEGAERNKERCRLINEWLKAGADPNIQTGILLDTHNNFEYKAATYYSARFASVHDVRAGVVLSKKGSKRASRDLFEIVVGGMVKEELRALMGPLSGKPQEN
ncbi:hypothetical protein M427DRAFT_53696 [Gonapodya prolifera JEL478]|uniref:Uncharacterized protein n=1 Tax=Gonapodya prolifera (strain JEL478) TaxID=1344416 RepID=A0A139APW7_GONPJ|nr:hypothetical protein M427DRAFT_53696 [Gonapodya prolifera JEL478]|eukprot:KXS18768.1 hypothetical protein M427DRAFT_53696 [Gonapodya prolifera JEL478]